MCLWSKMEANQSFLFSQISWRSIKVSLITSILFVDNDRISKGASNAVNSIQNNHMHIYFSYLNNKDKCCMKFSKHILRIFLLKFIKSYIKV